MIVQFDTYGTSTKMLWKCWSLKSYICHCYLFCLNTIWLSYTMHSRTSRVHTLHMFPPLYHIRIQRVSHSILHWRLSCNSQMNWAVSSSSWTLSHFPSLFSALVLFWRCWPTVLTQMWWRLSGCYCLIWTIWIDCQLSCIGNHWSFETICPPTNLLLCWIQIRWW